VLEKKIMTTPDGSQVAWKTVPSRAGRVAEGNVWEAAGVVLRPFFF
jgi:hypothetical protein